MKRQTESSSVSSTFKHLCYVTVIAGCYSCHWKFNEWKKYKLGNCCCNWKEQLFLPFLIISFGLSVLLLFVWVETANEYFGFDWAVYLTTGMWFYWSIVLLSIVGILAAYTSLLLVLAFLLIWEGNKLYLHWCHKDPFQMTPSWCHDTQKKQLGATICRHEAYFQNDNFHFIQPQILILIVDVIAIILLVVLCKLWRDKWLILGLSLKVFAPYWHVACITLMVIFSWPVSYYLVQLEGEALQMVIGLPFVIVLLFLYMMPLGIQSPCIQDKEKLGPKPVFFGHRGAPMVAPENTMMSFEKAVEQGVYGLETDIHISYDRVPFLMHDHDLKRTTNIKEVMPSVSSNRSDSFKWDFLSTLNAGEWFLKDKPFYDMKPLSKADRERARNQKIPKLQSLLDLAQKEKKFVLFDLTPPPPKHPYRNTFVRVVVSVILASKIEPHLIFWLPAFDRDYVRVKAPGFQHVGRLHSLEKLSKENIRIINVDYKELFYNGLRDYKAANITINLYVVNKPWLFSLAWCSRIHSVTTDNVKLLSEIDRPHFFMTPRYYMFIWLLIDVISAVLISAIFSFHWRKEKQRDKMFLRPTVAQDAQSTDLQMENFQKGLSSQPTTRTSQNPWSLKGLYPDLPKIAKYAGAFHLAAPSKEEAELKSPKENIKPPVAAKDIPSPMPKETTSRPAKASTQVLATRPTFQTSLPPFKVSESTGSLNPETHLEETPMVESSQESFLTAGSSSWTS